MRDAHHAVTRAAFPIVPGASRVCQSLQRLVEVDSPETVNDGVVSLNNSGNEDAVPRSEPESINTDNEAVHLREEELPSVNTDSGADLLREEEMPECPEVPERVSMLPESLATIGDGQQQHGMQPVVQHGGSSMTDVQSSEESLEEAVGEQQKVYGVGLSNFMISYSRISCRGKD
ncbi:hypothetical protein V6N11_073783 [Hibiscus sabdariffa]